MGRYDCPRFVGGWGWYDCSRFVGGWGGMIVLGLLGDGAV